MRALLDEGVPRKLVRLLRDEGYTVEPFPNEWKGTRNGRLLEMLSEAGLDCLITCDKNMHYQQKIEATGIAVVVLPTQALDILESNLQLIGNAITAARIGEAIVVRFPETH